MSARPALRLIAEITTSQWGLVTTAQAAARGVSRLDMSRLAAVGDLERLSHGVYRIAGAPAPDHLDLRAAWLSANPGELADERLWQGPADVTVSGESAARIHGIGDLRAMRHEFTVSTRRQTQRADVHYRVRRLSANDITVRAGLPVTTVERTIADLVEADTDLSLVGDALADAMRRGDLDAPQLQRALAPLAARTGYRRGDGAALLAGLAAGRGEDIER